jgi:hypothetical protein
LIRFSASLERFQQQQNNDDVGFNIIGVSVTESSVAGVLQLVLVSAVTCEGKTMHLHQINANSNHKILMRAIQSVLDLIPQGWSVRRLVRVEIKTTQNSKRISKEWKAF